MSAPERIGEITVRGQRPSLYEYMLQSVHLPIFPLSILRFEEDKTLQDYTVKIKVSSDLYRLIKTAYASSDIMTFIDLNDGRLGMWSFDMLTAFRILSKLNMMSDIESWTMKARASASNYLAKQKVDSKNPKPKALEVAREFLAALKLKDVIDNSEVIRSITKDIVSAKKMDANTIIYRLAMVLYHAKTVTGQAPVEAIEDTSNLYLKLSQSTFFKDHPDVFSEMAEFDVTNRNIVAKVLVTLVIAAYSYQKELS